MNCKLAKLLSEIQYRRIVKKDIRKVRKIINSEIKEAIKNGNNHSIIYLGNLNTERQSIAIEQEEYYKKKGFDVEVEKVESQFYTTKYYMKIIWKHDFLDEIPKNI